MTSKSIFQTCYVYFWLVVQDEDDCRCCRRSFLVLQRLCTFLPSRVRDLFRTRPISTHYCLLILPSHIFTSAPPTLTHTPSSYPSLNSTHKTTVFFDHVYSLNWLTAIIRLTTVTQWEKKALNLQLYFTHVNTHRSVLETIRVAWCLLDVAFIVYYIRIIPKLWS